MGRLRRVRIYPGYSLLRCTPALIERESSEDRSLNASLVASRSEFGSWVPCRQPVRIGSLTGDIEGKPGQHDEAGKVPLGLHFVLRRVVGVVVEVLERLAGKILRSALDLHA